MTFHRCTYIICTVTVKIAITEFIWDKGNLDKSRQKHGVTPRESEEVFLDENLKIQDDIVHSQTEPRYIALGKTQENKILFIIFTLRQNKIRIISARKAGTKEKNLYAKS